MLEAVPTAPETTAAAVAVAAPDADGYVNTELDSATTLVINPDIIIDNLEGKYCLSKKSCPNTYSRLLYKLTHCQNFLDI